MNLKIPRQILSFAVSCGIVLSLYAHRIINLFDGQVVEEVNDML